MTKSSTDQRQLKNRGYEDHDILEILAQILLDKPELTVTAAIRSLGISDQPSLRRLRDKHQAAVQKREDLAKALDNGRVIKFPAGASSVPIAAEQPSKPITELAAVVANDQQPQVKPRAPTADCPEIRKQIRDDMAAAGRPSAPFGAAVMLPDSFFETSGAGMRAWVSAFEMQQMMWFEMMRTLPMAAALRNQMMFCEWTIAAYRRAPKKFKDDREG